MVIWNMPFKILKMKLKRQEWFRHKTDREIVIFYNDNHLQWKADLLRVSKPKIAVVSITGFFTSPKAESHL